LIDAHAFQEFSARYYPQIGASFREPTGGTGTLRRQSRSTCGAKAGRTALKSTQLARPILLTFRKAGSVRPNRMRSVDFRSHALNQCVAFGKHERSSDHAVRDRTVRTAGSQCSREGAMDAPSYFLADCSLAASRARRSPSRAAPSSSFSLTPGSMGPVVAVAPASAQMASPFSF